MIRELQAMLARRRELTGYAKETDEGRRSLVVRRERTRGSSRREVGQQAVSQQMTFLQAHFPQTYPLFRPTFRTVLSMKGGACVSTRKKWQEG